jgi:Kef-type K+ transport system membrane component KefB
LFKQPLIVVFIGVGFLAGPAGIGVVEESETVDLLGRIGVALLLFVVGLKLDPALIRSSGAVAVVSGVGQVVITAGFGFLITLALGLDPLPAAYIALALTFSSTVIVVKLLTDRKELDSLYGRIALGILIVQDVLVIAALVLLTGIGSVDTGESLFVELGITILRGAALLLGVTVITRWVVPLVEDRIAASTETLVLGAVAWASGLAVAAEWAGFSIEMGAFLAGISLAGRPPRQLIAARLTSLRDFLLLFFFVGLGARIELADLQGQLLPAIILSAFVLIGNPLIIIGITTAMRYRIRTGFLAGTALAQISEFSFVIMAAGVSVAHVNQSDMALVTIVGLITFGASSYMILYSHRIYGFLRPFLRRFERSTSHPEEELSDGSVVPPQVLVFGTGRLGTVVLTRLQEQGIEALGIDFDPIAVRRLRDMGFHARFGDSEDPDFIATLPLSTAVLAISTVRLADVELTLLQALRDGGFAGSVILTSETTTAAQRLQNAGATFVLLPYEAAGERATEVIRQTLQDPTYLEEVVEEQPTDP